MASHKLTAMGPLSVSYSMALAITFFIFVFIDFIMYWLHRWEHENSFLWRIHKLHHTAQSLTPFTSNRFHPLDIAILFGTFVLPYIFYGLLTLIFNNIDFFLYSTPLFIVLFARFALLSPLYHSPVPISFGPLNQIFVSPAFHQIHHSSAKEHQNVNYGFALSVWDILFKTAVLPKKETFPLKYGVEGESPTPSLVQSLLGK